MWTQLFWISAEIGNTVFDFDCQVDQIRKALRGLMEPTSRCVCSDVSEDK